LPATSTTNNYTEIGNFSLALTHNLSLCHCQPIQSIEASLQTVARFHEA